MKTVYLTIFLLSLFSCGKQKNSISSKEFPTAQKRVKALQKYMNLKSPVEDCHFAIYDVNLNAKRSTPGPTDRKYEVALKVLPEHFSAWTQDLTHTSFPLNTGWYDSLLIKQNGFDYSTPTIMSKDGGKIVIGYENEGLLFIRIRQH